MANGRHHWVILTICKPKTGNTMYEVSTIKATEAEAEQFRAEMEQFRTGREVTCLKRRATKAETDVLRRTEPSKCPNHPGFGAEHFDCDCRECTPKPDSLEGVRLSPWIVVGDFYATRVLEGTDPDIVTNRVAFIEKTARVLHNDKWVSGHCGNSSEAGEAEKEQAYGFDPGSRKWCDDYLVAHGAILPQD